ncbi:hypothetical protein CONPUDRAFT_76952 [Coniophora puteana RWD-64-598 SS2]|uniref:Uncharacterized protein n=1 Tax=Coniophora puteana (strain RWD-64-598) TaxID=741705 RepID=A0A5M3M9Y0_CONPW|nr:uncharacterized protein CONPUDRAFT_76952 [Coniophora puteana RWD-64-598 SS2]EIW75907.1 hypothetical protein CONPUDRAFT_76952 [Coniophora puteana RWD-64-598 SS2]
MSIAIGYSRMTGNPHFPAVQHSSSPACHKPHRGTHKQHYVYPSLAVPLEVMEKAAQNISDSPLPSPLPSPPSSVPSSPSSAPTAPPSSLAPFPLSLDPSPSLVAVSSLSQAAIPLTAQAKRKPSPRKKKNAAAKFKITPALKCSVSGCTGRAPSSAYECDRKMCATHCGFEGGCHSVPTHVDLRPMSSQSQAGPSASQTDESSSQAALARAIDDALSHVDPTLRPSAPSAKSLGKRRADDMPPSTAPPALQATRTLTLPSSGRPETTEAPPFGSTRYTVQLNDTWNGKFEIDQSRMVRNISGEHIRKACQRDVKKVLKVFIYYDDKVDPKLLYLQGQANLPTWPYFSLLACAQARPSELHYLHEDTLVDKWDSGEFQVWASCDISVIHTVRENDTLLFKLREVQECFGLDTFTSRLGKMKTPVNAMSKTDISLMRKRPRPPTPDLLASPQSSEDSPYNPMDAVPSPSARSIRRKVSPSSHVSSSSSSSSSPSPSRLNPSPSHPGPSLLQPQPELVNRIVGLPLPKMPPSVTVVPLPPSPLGPSPMLPAKVFDQEPNHIQWPTHWHVVDVLNGLYWLRSPSLRSKGLLEVFKHVFGTRYVRSTVYETVDKWGKLEPSQRCSFYKANHTPMGYWRALPKKPKKKKKITTETVDMDFTNIPVTPPIPSIPRIKIEPNSEVIARVSEVFEHDLDPAAVYDLTEGL